MNRIRFIRHPKPKDSEKCRKYAKSMVKPKTNFKGKPECKHTILPPLQDACALIGYKRTFEIKLYPNIWQWLFCVDPVSSFGLQSDQKEEKFTRQRKANNLFD